LAIREVAALGSVAFLTFGPEIVRRDGAEIEQFYGPICWRLAMTEIIIGLSAFAAGMLCGTAMVGPKIYSVVSGTMSEMSHDLNPRRDLPQ
jgi:hypothetical protein